MSANSLAFTNRPAIWDGGMGSLLIAAGLRPGQSPEAWNIERPEVVAAAHRAYYAAGADVVQTNTFGGNRFRLQDAKCPYPVERVNREAAAIALAERPAGRLVAGDIGPSGLALPPVGHADEQSLTDAFAEQAAVLCTAGVDFLSVETMSDLREARAALRGARSVCRLPVMVSLTFRQTRRGFFTIFGDPAVESLRTLRAEGAAGTGANCTLGSAAMTMLGLELRPAVEGLLLLQPNAGEPRIIREGNGYSTVYPEGPDEFTARLEPLFAAGIDALGGCCGTGPAHIQALATRREARRGPANF